MVNVEGGAGGVGEVDCVVISLLISLFAKVSLINKLEGEIIIDNFRVNLRKVCNLLMLPRSNANFV